jgi:hypothetical protein
MPFKLACAVGFGRPFGRAPIGPQREIARRAPRSLPNGVKQRRRSDAMEHRWHRRLAAVVFCAFTQIATCRFCIDERAGTLIAFLKVGHLRDGTISKKENQMKSKIAYPALAAASLLALTQLAAAQGTSGGTGAIASIPGSVVRGHEQGHGLMSIITGSTRPQPNASRETITRRGQKPTPPK